MSMHIAFRILADGTDVTANFQDRLISLTLIDEVGQNADQAEIVVDDRDYMIALPQTGAKLQIALGFVAERVEIGTYVVDEVSGAFGPDSLTISARAVDMTGSIRARKTRTWTDVTIADIVAKIAAEEGLEAQVSDSLKARFHAWLAQTSERRSECPHPAGPRPRCDRQARRWSAAVP